jgi:hypothetical protein
MMFGRISRNQVKSNDKNESTISKKSVEKYLFIHLLIYLN